MCPGKWTQPLSPPSIALVSRATDGTVFLYSVFLCTDVPDIFIQAIFDGRSAQKGSGRMSAQPPLTGWLPCLQWKTPALIAMEMQMEWHSLGAFDGCVGLFAGILMKGKVSFHVISFMVCKHVSMFLKGDSTQQEDLKDSLMLAIVYRRWLIRVYLHRFLE